MQFQKINLSLRVASELQLFMKFQIHFLKYEMNI